MRTGFERALSRGVVNGADASLAAQWAADIGGTGIPEITGDPSAPTAGQDPRLYLPQLTATPGQTVTVALRLNAVESFTLTSADVALLFDAHRFQISNVRLSSSMHGFAAAPNIDNTNGTLKAAVYTGGLGQNFVQGQDVPMLLFDVTVAKDAPAGPASLNLAQQVGGVHTALNGGALTLSPAPTNGAFDAGVDGLVTVMRTGFTTAALPKLASKTVNDAVVPSTLLAWRAPEATALEQYWILEGQEHSTVSTAMYAAPDGTDWESLAWALQGMKKTPS